MDDNQMYIKNLKYEDVPWNRLTTTYGRATDFPACFKIMWDMEDMNAVKKAMKEVIINIEHQSTFWHATPFAIVFLVGILKKSVLKMNSNETAYFIAEKLLDFFCMAAQCCHDEEKMEHEKHLPLFSDMLKEEYLWSEEYDEEEDELRYESGEVFPDDLFYSFYYYSYQAVLCCKPVLKDLENTKLCETAEKLKKLL